MTSLEQLLKLVPSTLLCPLLFSAFLNLPHPPSFLSVGVNLYTACLHACLPPTYTHIPRRPRTGPGRDPLALINNDGGGVGGGGGGDGDDQMMMMMMKMIVS